MDGPLLHSLSKRLSVCTVLHSLKYSTKQWRHWWLHLHPPRCHDTRHVVHISMQVYQYINTWWNIMAGFMTRTSVVPSVVRVQSWLRSPHRPSPLLFLAHFNRKKQSATAYHDDDESSRIGPSLSLCAVWGKIWYTLISNYYLFYSTARLTSTYDGSILYCQDFWRNTLSFWKSRWNWSWSNWQWQDHISWKRGGLCLSSAFC